MNRIVKFAEKELQKYWEKITGEKNANIALVYGNNPDCFAEHYVIDVCQGKGKITAENPKSVLLAVYHFLRKVGCAFLLPTASGEYIPSKKAEEITVQLDFTPTHRHRGITLEGTCSCEHVLNLVDWAVKNGYNSYFIQFRTGYTFFDRWHKHNFNPYADHEHFDDALAEEINKQIRSAMAERGMIFHAVGHGWTCEPFGIPSRGWDKISEIPEEFKDCFAQINGKREFYKGIPLNTNLCYSNPKVRKYVVNDIVSYAKNNPEVDVLHVWLGDNYNNYCECEECAKKTPSDWYVILLNEIDEALTKAGVDTKIVFLVYFELLFAPKTEVIRNQDRFIMMFAPITRTYDETWEKYIDKARDLPLPELTVNHFVPPVDAAENIAHFMAWQKMFHGDSFVFDYPLMWDVCKEYGGIKLAKTIYGDIHSLDKIPLGGYISCQLQRNFYPTGFCMYVMANSLYDGSRSYEELKEEYFSLSFEKFADEIYGILEELSTYRIYNYMKKEIHFADKQMHGEIPHFVERITLFQEKVSAMMKEECKPFVLRNLRMIASLLEFVRRVCGIIYEKTADAPDMDKVNALLREVQLYIFSVEPQFENFIDAAYFYTFVDEMSQRK